MDKVARQEKAKIYGFSYLTKNQSFLADLLRKKSFNISLAVPNTYIEINWKNFDGYIDYLKKNHQNMAKNVLKEIRKNKNAGIHIEKISGFSHLADQFACLFGETYYRHTRKKSELTKQFFQNISSHGNDIANAYCAFKGDTLRAFSIVLEGKDIWHSLLSGQNYEADRQDSSFFNVVFYAPIREAIRNNARRIYFGPANYEAKLRRGCLIEPLSMCFKSSNTCINKLLSYWFRITEIWYQRKYQELLLPRPR